MSTFVTDNNVPFGVINDASNLILIEHCYARPHNWKPESNFLKPTKTLFMQHENSKNKPLNSLAPSHDHNERIDVCTIETESPTIYDKNKARHLMDECERHASCARVNEGDENWEENISKINWTSSQIKLFNGIVHILNLDNLARLAYVGTHNEPIYRRTVIDKSVRRVRQLLASILWDFKLIQWLHQLLIEHLSTRYLAAYLDILQTLKAKLPAFIDKLMYGPNSSNRVGIMSNESLFNLLKKPWDPVASSLNNDKPKKLPNNPIIIAIPSVPYNSTNQLKRFHKWINLLSNFANVQTVNIGTSSLRMTMTNCVDQMLATTRAKIQEIKSLNPGRQIILAGFNAGSALALQAAQMESVLCVLCVGFSLHTAEGRRGDLDDNLLELLCPILFVIGQCSNTSLQEEIEDLRERMRVETGLIIVGSADDCLRISKKKKRSEGITQSIVDRCIVDEIGEFISGILLSPHPPHIKQSVGPPVDIHKRSKLDRKRNNSNGSSLDSEPPSPTPRITRPVGRPPGSKSKNKLENKWSTRGITTDNPSPTCPSSNIQSDNTPNHQTKTPQKSITLDFNKKISSKIFSNEINTKSTTNKPLPSVAKLQGINRGLIQTSTLSSLLQGRTTQQKPNNPVLENLAVNTNPKAKLLSTTPTRTIDLSKITIINSNTASNPGNSYSNVLLMPDRTKPGGVTRYITSKKQLLGNKPPKPVQKIWNKPVQSPNLLPPTNLTSEDIMDLPIIFADDNQIINSSVIQPAHSSQQTVENASHLKTTHGKLLFINKAVPTLQSVKRLQQPNQSPLSNTSNKNAVKYAKIILSKKLDAPEKQNTFNLPFEETKTIDNSTESMDVEDQLRATAVPKMNLIKDTKKVTQMYINEGVKLQNLLNDQTVKRTLSQTDMKEENRSSKNLKLDD